MGHSQWPGEKPGEDSQEEECGGGRSQEQKILPPGQGFLVCKWIQGGHTEGVPLPGDHGYGRVIAAEYSPSTLSA